VPDEATKPYLDYLEREMTIQGILSTFCIVASAAALDRVLAVEPDKTSQFVLKVQAVACPYFVCAIVALVSTAWFFYWQRSELAWLNGQIGLAVLRETRGLKVPKDGWTMEELIEQADSWSIWAPYKCGLTLLAISAAEIALVFIVASFGTTSPSHWLAASLPVLIGVAVMVWQWRESKLRDSGRETAKKKRQPVIRKAASRITSSNGDAR
jgi:hypothetical protein